ncbi:YccF domain-containing protein [Kitasatospora sp. NPDC058162]|uniref:YccF domain-containing protein n=1 Tax=Kitasatospora sp. NPDC058162 TaxID=3346362 RepID=UPI0036DCB29D
MQVEARVGDQPGLDRRRLVGVFAPLRPAATSVGSGETNRRHAERPNAIPFGIASFRIAGFILWPFGRTTVERRDAGAASCVGNVIWFVFAGWWLAIGHLLTSIPLFLSIIGIPFGWANLKMIPISLMPLGREIVSTDQEWGARY